MAEVVVVATILGDEDVDLLEVDVACMEADRVLPLRKDLDNAGIVDAEITSSRSAGRNLVDLSGLMSFMFNVSLLNSYLSVSLLNKITVK